MAKVGRRQRRVPKSECQRGHAHCRRSRGQSASTSGKSWPSARKGTRWTCACWATTRKSRLECAAFSSTGWWKSARSIDSIGQHFVVFESNYYLNKFYGVFFYRFKTVTESFHPLTRFKGQQCTTLWPTWTGIFRGKRTRCAKTSFSWSALRRSSSPPSWRRFIRPNLSTSPTSPTRPVQKSRFAKWSSSC